MRLFFGLRRYVRNILLCLLALVFIRMLVCCTFIDVLLMMGLVLAILALTPEIC